MSKSKPAFLTLLIPLFTNLIFPLYSFAQIPQEETLTITTYYLAPYGVYNELRSKRMAIGDTWFNAANFCWAADPSCGPDNIASEADLVVEGNVGIGTANPGGKFHISGSQDESSSRFGTIGVVQRLSATNNGVEARWFAGVSGTGKHRYRWLQGYSL